MSLSGHLRELDARHRRLEAEIAEERKRPFADTLRLTALKREKLKVKEQLTAAKPRKAA
jgi:hypothetical protein